MMNLFMGFINEGLKTLVKINFLIEIDQLFWEVTREFIQSQKSMCLLVYVAFQYNEAY